MLPAVFDDCEACGEHAVFTQGSKMYRDENGHRIYDLKCSKCGAVKPLDIDSEGTEGGVE